MSYKSLSKFKLIFDRDDFNFVSDEKNIEEIKTIILYRIREVSKEDELYIKILKNYLNNFNSFYGSVLDKNIHKINKSFITLVDILQKCISLFSESELRRKSISTRYVAKFNKIFSLGLSKFADSLKILFDPNEISLSRISKNQIINYIFDNFEGLGKNFLFDKKGKHSFVNKISELNMQELLVTLRLLAKPSRNQIRIFNCWKDLGLGHSPVRILVKASKTKKDKIFFLYRLNEHTAYEAQLRISPDDSFFDAA